MADTNSDNVSTFTDPAGHPPVFGRKRKIGTRPKKSLEPGKGGASMLESMFSPSSKELPTAQQQEGACQYSSVDSPSFVPMNVWEGAPTTAATPGAMAGLSMLQKASSAAASPAQGEAHRTAPGSSSGGGQRAEINSGEVVQPGHNSTDGKAAQPELQTPAGSTTTKLPFRVSQQADTGSSKATREASSVPREYSNEARVYHCKYAELSEAYDDQHYDYVRDGCLALLIEPNLPRYTRIQTLQIVSTLVRPAIAQNRTNQRGTARFRWS